MRSDPPDPGSESSPPKTSQAQTLERNPGHPRPKLGLGYLFPELFSSYPSEFASGSAEPVSGVGRRNGQRVRFPKWIPSNLPSPGCRGIGRRTSGPAEPVSGTGQRSCPVDLDSVSDLGRGNSGMDWTLHHPNGQEAGLAKPDARASLGYFGSTHFRSHGG